METPTERLQRLRNALREAAESPDGADLGLEIRLLQAEAQLLVAKQLAQLAPLVRAGVDQINQVAKQIHAAAKQPAAARQTGQRR